MKMNYEDIEGMVFGNTIKLCYNIQTQTHHSTFTVRKNFSSQIPYDSSNIVQLKFAVHSNKKKKNIPASKAHIFENRRTQKKLMSDGFVLHALGRVQKPEENKTRPFLTTCYSEGNRY